MSWAAVGKALVGIFTGPAGLVATVGGELLQDFIQGRRRQRQVEQAAADFRQRKALQDDAYVHEWELQALTNSGIWMRRGTLILFCWPLFWAYIDPDACREYFDTLGEMPEWYLASLGTMLAAVWGSQKLRELRAGRPPK